MHWLPLVAMVIASALPFPQNPVSKIAAATDKPGFDNRRELRHDPAAPVDYSFNGSASQTDYNMIAAFSQRTNKQNLQSRKDFVKSVVHKETFEVENRGTYQSNSSSGGDGRSSLFVPTEGGTLRTENVSQDNSLPKDYKASSSRYENSSFVDFSKKDNPQDSTDRPLQVSSLESRDVSPTTTPKGQTGPKLTAPSDQLRDAPTIRSRSRRTLGTGRGLTEESLTVEAGLGLGAGLDSILDGDEMFLDAHPRVLFSPSPSPPEHPPVLLMLESDLQEDTGDGEEQEDIDGHIEGHGDRALDGSWADSSKFTSDAVHSVKREKRAHLTDQRRGERSVCESENSWRSKQTAIDINGQEVTVLQHFKTPNGNISQYFFETLCRQPERSSDAGKSKGAGAAVKPKGTGFAGASCLGVDKKEWNSECKVKQSYVRALTKNSRNRVAWNWIRINSSCVCVLSRVNQRPARGVLLRKGSG